jgi:Xaa-Pro aminopeptidase
MQLDWHGSERLGSFDAEPADSDIDMVAVRAHRLARARQQIAQHDLAACLLFDPVNVRYATGARNMQVFHQRNPARYLFLPVEGPVILFEFTGCMHLADGLETLDEVRPAITASYVAAGEAIAEREQFWARETAALLRETVGPGQRIGIERVNAGAALALAAEGFDLADAQAPIERARAIKSPEEVKCVVASLRATERAVGTLRDAIRPGITENQLWSLLHRGVIAADGDYVETRLLSSGPRSNPWFQECGPRVVEANELVALDTDVVGRFGYYADFSRTFHSGPGRPSAAQRDLYKTAHEQLHHNMALLNPGLSFKEYSKTAWDIPARYAANRYYLSAHGVGMTGEYPYLYHRADYDAAGYDGIIEPGMTLCVESYIGEENGREGVKLEQQLLITERGSVLLSRFPFEDALLV